MVNPKGKTPEIEPFNDLLILCLMLIKMVYASAQKAPANG